MFLPPKKLLEQTVNSVNHSNHHKPWSPPLYWMIWLLCGNVPARPPQSPTAKTWVLVPRIVIFGHSMPEPTGAVPTNMELIWYWCKNVQYKISLKLSEGPSYLKGIPQTTKWPNLYFYLFVIRLCVLIENHAEKSSAPTMVGSFCASTSAPHIPQPHENLTSSLFALSTTDRGWLVCD